MKLRIPASVALAAITACTLTLAACGQKGPLKFPEPPASPASAPATAK